MALFFSVLFALGILLATAGYLKRKSYKEPDLDKIR
jgi:hypothetical protein